GLHFLPQREQTCRTGRDMLVVAISWRWSQPVSCCQTGIRSRNERYSFCIRSIVPITSSSPWFRSLTKRPKSLIARIRPSRLPWKVSLLQHMPTGDEGTDRYVPQRRLTAPDVLPPPPPLFPASPACNPGNPSSSPSLLPTICTRPAAFASRNRGPATLPRDDEKRNGPACRENGKDPPRTIRSRTDRSKCWPRRAGCWPIAPRPTADGRSAGTLPASSGCFLECPANNSPQADRYPAHLQKPGN